MTEKTKALCSGCYNDFYNHRTNCDGKSECWSYEKAQVVQRVSVGTFQPPPYKRNPQDCLSCFHAKGCSMLEMNDCRIKKPEATIARATGEDVGP